MMSLTQKSLSQKKTVLQKVVKYTHDGQPLLFKTDNPDVIVTTTHILC